MPIISTSSSSATRTVLSESFTYFVTNLRNISTSESFWVFGRTRSYYNPRSIGISLPDDILTATSSIARQHIMASIIFPGFN